MAKQQRSQAAAERIDDYVGGRIRERRISLGMTQQQFGQNLGLTYQQTYKYEQGINRVSAGRLYEIARVLDVPVTYFYEGAGDDNPPKLTQDQQALLDLASNFAAIKDEKHQEALNHLVRVLARR